MPAPSAGDALGEMALAVAIWPSERCRPVTSTLPRCGIPACATMLVAGSRGIARWRWGCLAGVIQFFGSAGLWRGHPEATGLYLPTVASILSGDIRGALGFHDAGWCSAGVF